MSVPPTELSLPPARGDASRGSLLLGFLLGWAVLIGGYVLIGLIAAVVAQVIGAFDGAVDAYYAVGGISPWAVLIGLIVFFAIKNKPRTAIGIALAMGSMILVALALAVLFIVVLAAAFKH